jgi:hypothetical protein
MLNNSRVAAQVRQTIMWEALLFVGVLVIAFWAVAFIIVNQVLTGAGLASTVRAIRDVVTVMDTRLTPVVRKTAVALAFEVIHMLACWTLLIFALPIWCAVVLW